MENDHIVIINLEDRRNRKLRDPDALLDYIDSKLTDEAVHYIMIDEIQHVSEFKDLLNSYLNMPNADIRSDYKSLWIVCTTFRKVA